MYFWYLVTIWTFFGMHIKLIQLNIKMKLMKY